MSSAMRSPASRRWPPPAAAAMAAATAPPRAGRPSQCTPSRATCPTPRRRAPGPRLLAGACPAPPATRYTAPAAAHPCPHRAPHLPPPLSNPGQGAGRRVVGAAGRPRRRVGRQRGPERRVPRLRRRRGRRPGAGAPLVPLHWASPEVGCAALPLCLEAMLTAATDPRPAPAAPQVVRTNLLGALLCAREAARRLSAQPAGGHLFLMDGAGSGARGPLPWPSRLLRAAPTRCRRRPRGPPFLSHLDLTHPPNQRCS